MELIKIKLNHDSMDNVEVSAMRFVNGSNEEIVFKINDVVYNHSTQYPTHFNIDILEVLHDTEKQVVEKVVEEVKEKPAPSLKDLIGQDMKSLNVEFK